MVTLHLLLISNLEHIEQVTDRLHPEEALFAYTGRDDDTERDVRRERVRQEAHHHLRWVVVHPNAEEAN